MLHDAQKHVVNDYIDFDMLLASFNIFFWNESCFFRL